jgi:hypothetical protein
VGESVFERLRAVPLPGRHAGVQCSPQPAVTRQDEPGANWMDGECRAPAVEGLCRVVHDRVRARPESVAVVVAREQLTAREYGDQAAAGKPRSERDLRRLQRGGASAGKLQRVEALGATSVVAAIDADAVGSRVHDVWRVGIDDDVGEGALDHHVTGKRRARLVDRRDEDLFPRDAEIDRPVECPIAGNESDTRLCRMDRDRRRPAARAPVVRRERERSAPGLAPIMSHINADTCEVVERRR